MDFSFLVYDIIIHFIRFVGDFVTAIIVFNFILFYFARRLAWWHLHCKTIVFLITAKKLDNFTFNTFTFSYPIFHARVNHFPNIRAIHAKIGAPKYKISPSPSNKPLNAAGSLRPGSVQWKLVPNHKHGKLILKNKRCIYWNIFVYIFFVLFFCLLPHCGFIIFYKRLGWSLGWSGFVTSTQSEEKERASAGLTSDISLGSLAFNDNAFSVRSRLCFESKIQLNTVVYNILSYRSVSRSKTL